MYPKKIFPDPFRSLGYGSISSSYAAVGTALTEAARIVKFTNDTDQLVYISWDGTHNHVYLPAGAFTLLDCTANLVRDDGFFIAVGTQFYAKAPATLPTSGNVVIEIYYGVGTFS